MKIFLNIILGFIGLLLAAIILLFVFFDPNDFKSRIEAAAQQQGIALQINGNLGWKFWPGFGVEVNDIRVASVEAPDQSIAQLKQASFLLALRPLLTGELNVHHLLVDGAVIELVIDQNGEGNWETLVKDSASAEGEPSPSTERELKLAVEKISVQQSALHYDNQQTKQAFSVDDLNLDIDQFNLQGEAFTVQLSLLAEMAQSGAAEKMSAVKIQIGNRLQLTRDNNSLTLTDGNFTVTTLDDEATRLTGTYEVSARELKAAKIFSGQLTVASFNAKKIMDAMGIAFATRESYALTDLAFNTHFEGNVDAITFDPLNIVLDKTTLKGTLAITDFAAPAINLVLNGDQIIIDDYLGPDAPEAGTAAEASVTTPAQVTATSSSGDENLIPLELIKTLDLDISANFSQVTIADMPLKNIQLKTTAKDGLIHLNKAQAKAYDGLLDATATLDGRGDTAVIDFSGKLDSVQLEPLFKDLELTDKVEFTGAVNAGARGKATGITTNQILDSLVSELQFSGAQVRLLPYNIEQQFCRIVDLVNRAEDPQKTWEAFTEMEKVSGKISMAQRIIRVESFTAGVEQLILGTTGQLNLANNTYDLRLPLTLVATPVASEGDTESNVQAVAATSEQGCVIGSHYWLNRGLSLLRCHGHLNTLDPLKDCRPDSKGLASLTKDFAEYRLREKHGKKIDAAEQKVDEKKDELRKKLDEKLGGEGEGKKAEELLKNLFKKKKNEQ